MPLAEEVGWILEACGLRPERNKELRLVQQAELDAAAAAAAFDEAAAKCLPEVDR